MQRLDWVRVRNRLLNSERIQKRALSIISPAVSYRECLDSLGLPTLYDRRNGLCRQLFDSIAINPGHKLYHLLPPRKQSSYNLRRQKLPYIICHVPVRNVSDALLFMLCPRVAHKALKVSKKSTLL